MGELLAWDGVWTRRLLELMVRVAEEIEVGQCERQFIATQAAASALFNRKGAEALQAWIRGVRSRVEAAQLAARGEDPKSIAKDRAAGKLIEALGVEEGAA